MSLSLTKRNQEYKKISDVEIKPMSIYKDRLNGNYLHDMES